MTTLYVATILYYKDLLITNRVVFGFGSLIGGMCLYVIIDKL